ncbi:MAG TPA: helix-turn-helix transcriptional regulator [bacterium]|nr:helix-turn-helix transcriptional regulator [bacterium]
MSESVFTSGYDQLRALLVETRRSSGLTQQELARRLKKPQSFVSKYELGERRLDVIEFLQVAAALETDPRAMMGLLLNPKKPAIAGGRPENILQKWGINETELTRVVHENPSLRGILLGYVAELKFEETMKGHPGITYITKHDDHNRKRKGDRFITYKGKDFIVEVKSLQTNSIARAGNKWVGKAQVDASDRRDVKLPDGSTLNTTCLLTGEFDLLAVNLFAFEEKWRFVFARNQDLPRSGFKKYSLNQRKWLLATLVTVTWPPAPPFYEDPFVVLDLMARGRKR